MNALWCWYSISASIWGVSWLKAKLFEFGLGYDVVMKLCKDISGKKSSCLLWQPVYICSSYWRTCWLIKHTAIGQYWVRIRKYLPEGIHKPGRIDPCDAYKSIPNHTWQLKLWWPLLWQDNRIVRPASTNSDPRNVIHTDSRVGPNMIQVNQPQNIQLYNRYMNGVDCHDEMCKWNMMLATSQSKHGSTSSWYFVNTSIVNAYILYCMTSTRQTKKKHVLILTF